MLLKIGWHGIRQVFRVVVIFRFPAENLKSSKLIRKIFFLFFLFFFFFVQTQFQSYLVQLEENARGRLVVTVFVFLRALSPRGHVHVANFTGRRWFPIVAQHPLLGAIRRGSRFLVLWNEFKINRVIITHVIVSCNNQSPEKDRKMSKKVLKR